MTEKIEWYKEVLELEPNSKVFFPLARMLANEGATEEAIDIIEKGLVRHPEFLEARLYCIELLHKCGRIDACHAHVERLSKMLAAYGEFWRAWASCIAAMKESGSEDTASALRFLAANFLHGPISLSKVIEEGLAAVLGENRQDAAQVSRNAPETVGVSETSVAAEPVETVAAPLEEAVPAVEDVAQPAAAPAADDLLDMAVAAPLEETVPAVEDVAQPAAAPVVDDLLDMAVAAPLEETVPAVEDVVQPATAPAADDLLDMAVAAPLEEAVPAVEDVAQPAAAPAADDLLDMAVAAPLEETVPAVEDVAQPAAAPAADGLLDMAVAAPLEETVPAVEDVAQPAAAPVVEEGDQAVMEADALLTDDALFAEVAAPGGTDDAMFADMEEEAALADLDATLEADELPETAAMPAGDADAAASVPGNDISLDMPSEAAGADDAPQPETFSIRTRSMAEVLAEQGDIQGALEIYQELAQAAEGSEKDELSQRIVTLQARLGGAVPTPAVEEAPIKAPTGKEQVLSVLTSLAKGLENRAH